MKTRAVLFSVSIAALGAGTALAGVTVAKVGTGNTSIGTVLVSRSSGRTLYLFEGDSKSKFGCSGSCLKDWPPLEAARAAGSGGAKSGELGQAARGSNRQVTYNGHPLYYFSGDTKAGETNGQGLKLNGKLWFAVSPSGGAMTAAANSGSSGGSGSTPAW